MLFRSDFHVAVLDLGVKRSILKELADRGCSMTIYPYGTKAKTILEAKPDGVFLTNGPGDPASATEAVAVIEKLITNSNYGWPWWNRETVEETFFSRLRVAGVSRPWSCRLITVRLRSGAASDFW